MKKRNAIIAAVALSSISAVCSAESFYIFGSAGQSDVDTGAAGVAGLNLDETDTTFNLGVGYQLNDYFSVEAGYVDLGEARISTTSPVSDTFYGSTVTVDGTLSADASGFFVGVKGSAPLTEKASVFARAGFLNWESDAAFSGTVTIDGDTVTGSASAEAADGTDPYIAVGAAYSFTDQFAVDLQWSRYMLDYDGDDADVDTVTIGATVKF